MYTFFCQYFQIFDLFKDFLTYFILFIKVSINYLFNQNEFLLSNLILTFKEFDLFIVKVFVLFIKLFYFMSYLLMYLI